MLTFDSTLTTSLSNAVDKISWANVILTALGNTRTLRCFRDSNSGASNPFNTGTEFLNVAMTGAMVITAGNITGFGVAGTTSIRLAADLSTGASILRIEGNGHFIQGTFGLAGSGCDFTTISSPTTSTGIGFSAAAEVQAPSLLPSGTGPGAPTLDSNAPSTLTLQDWTVPSSPVTVGTITFDTRQLDFVFDDADLATNMGDVRVTQSSTSIVFGAFEFGATMFSMNTVVNADSTTPLHQVLVACKPYGTWSSYPAASTYNIATDVTYPGPFKLLLKTAGGALLHTFQMQDGLPINDPSLSQSRSDTAALRPFFNCAMMLPWQSASPKVSTKATHWFNGMVTDILRPSQAKRGYTFNASVPLVASRFQINSLNHWFALPQWPMPSDQIYGSTTTLNTQDPNSDPYLFNVPTYYSGGGGAAKAARAVGWDYEPGSISGHDWYTGPGGPRADRAVVPSILALYMTQPSGSRLKDGTSYKVMANAWGLGYFNHSHHYITNVKTFGTIPDSQTVYGAWAHTGAYYGSSNTYVPGGLSNEIDVHAIPNGGTAPAADKNGNVQWDGWAMDFLHNYCQPGWWTLIFNSPMHVVSAKLRHNANWMAQLGSSTGTANTNGFFMVRQQAWRWLHLVMMWKLSSSHSLSISRAMMEDRFKIELETMYDDIYVPAVINNDQNAYFVGMRNLGIPAQYTTIYGTNNYSYTALSNSLTYYMAHVLALMKQTGCWTAMMNKSAKCQTALLWLIRCLDLYSIDFILDSKGVSEYYPSISPTAVVGQASTIATSWANWATSVRPLVGSEDWITNSDGTFVSGGERDVSQHLRAQYAFIRRDFFPEIANARLTAACAAYQSYYDRIAANVAAQTSPANMVSADWSYRYPSLGLLATPV